MFLKCQIQRRFQLCGNALLRGRGDVTQAPLPCTEVGFTQILKFAIRQARIREYGIAKRVGGAGPFLSTGVCGRARIPNCDVRLDCITDRHVRIERATAARLPLDPFRGLVESLLVVEHRFAIGVDQIIGNTERRCRIGLG